MLVLSVTWPSCASATFSASSAAVATSGFTPTPSQLVFVRAFSLRPPGTKMVKPGASGIMPPGLAPPPVTSPTTLIRFNTCIS